MKTRPRIVIHYESGRVAAIAADGQPIAELAGNYQDVRERILAAADEHTRFRDWRDKSRGGTRSRQLFASLDLDLFEQPA